MGNDDVIDLSAVRQKRQAAAAELDPDRGSKIHVNDEHTMVIYDPGEGYDWILNWDPEDAVYFGKQVADMGRQLQEYIRRKNAPPEPPPEVCPFCKWPVWSLTRSGRFPKHPPGEKFEHGWSFGNCRDNGVCPSSLRTPVSARRLYLKRGGA